MKAIINVEGLVALAFVIAVVVRAGTLGKRDPILPANDVAYAAGLLLVVIGAFWSSLFFPLVSDDYILVMQAIRPAGSLLERFLQPGGDGSYRPVGHFLLITNGTWAQTDAFLWHSISLMVHATNCLLLYAATRYGFKRADIAAVASGIFAVHGTRPEAVAWLAGFWDVLAVLFTLIGLLAFLRYYATGSWIACTFSAVFVAMGIMCKESAYAFPALALAFVAARRFDRRLFAALLAPVLMLAYRFVLFHGPGGYVDAHTGRAQILNLHVVPTVQALFLRLWGVLLFPINWGKPPEFYLGAAIAIMLACLAALCFMRNALSRNVPVILAVCTFAAALPAVHLLSIAADLLGSRLLYLPSIPFALFLAVAVTSVERIRAARLAAACILLFYAATLVHNLGIWGRVTRLADRTCREAAAQLTGAPAAAIAGVPVAIDGVYFFANGLPECVALRSSNPPSQWTITHVPGSIDEKPGQRVLVWDGRDKLK